MEYKVIVVSRGYKENEHAAVEKLEREVNQHLKQGWKPQGGVSVALNTDWDQTLTQALVRDVAP